MNIMYTDIEFVCSLNNGRSPVAEAVARNIVRFLGLSETVSLSSSGTYVDLSGFTDEDLLNKIEPGIYELVKHGTFSPDILERVKTNPWMVLEETLALEEEWRNDYINHLTNYDSKSIRKDFKFHQRTQTIFRPNAQLILPIDDENLHRIREIYKNIRYSPRIENLFDYASMETPKIKIYSLEDYIQVASEIEKATEIAIRKSVNS